jgi:hypothetical protein
MKNNTFNGSGVALEKRIPDFRGILACMILCMSIGFSLPSQGEEYEISAILKLGDVVDDSEFNNKLYQVSENVQSDGFLNRYKVTSEFGEWDVSSTVLLKLRLREIEAIAKMREIDEEESVDGAIEEDVDQVKDGVSGLIEDPAGAIQGAASGVGKLFKLTGESWKSRHTRKDESQMESLGKAVSGYDKAWRKYAGEFGVDPYSSNQVLQEELDRLATAAAQGGVFAIAVKSLIPGGLGFAISATGMTQALNEVLITSSEVELRIINREKMLGMEMDPELVERYLDDNSSSSTYKTYLVGALETMHGVKGRHHFIEHALNSPSEDVSIFRSTSAIMYAWYHKEMKSIDRFERSDTIAVAVDTGNQLVIQAPLDHVLWTESLNLALESIDETIGLSQDFSNKLFMLPGTMSGRAKEEIEDREWLVTEKIKLN